MSDNKGKDVDFIDIDNELMDLPERKTPKSHSSKSGSKGSNGSKSSKNRRRKQRRRRLMIRRTVFVVALLMFIFSSVMLLKSWFNYLQADKIYNNIEDQVFADSEPINAPTKSDSDSSSKDETYTVSSKEKKVTLLKNYNHQALVNLNSDAVGYIQLPALGVLLPMVQGSDNSHYLNHALTGEGSSSGTIFINCFNTEGLESKNAIIYGHNMKNGSMFGNLKKYINEDFFNEGENRFFYIYTGNVIYKYEIYSVHTTPAISEAGGTYTTDFASDADFVNYLNSMAKLSYHNSDVALTADSKTITLSTCTNDNNTRFVVQAVRVETIYR